MVRYHIIGVPGPTRNPGSHPRPAGRHRRFGRPWLRLLHVVAAIRADEVGAVEHGRGSGEQLGRSFGGANCRGDRPPSGTWSTNASDLFGERTQLARRLQLAHDGGGHCVRPRARWRWRQRKPTSSDERGPTCPAKSRGRGTGHRSPRRSPRRRVCERCLLGAHLAQHCLVPGRSFPCGRRKLPGRAGQGEARAGAVGVRRVPYGPCGFPCPPAPPRPLA